MIEAEVRSALAVATGARIRTVPARTRPGWRRSWITGGALALAVLPLYLRGFGRPYGYDESVTVGHFVQTGSVFDALGRQFINNNHPLVSFLDHLIYSATGRHDEVAMRMCPLLAALAAVTVLTAVAIRRFGVLAGLAAGAFLATNPFFAAEAQTVRGYTLLLLCTIVSTALLTEEEQPVWKPIAYVLVVAAGTATHVYMVPVVICQGVYLAARRELNLDWCVRMGAGLAIGGLLTVRVLVQVLQSGRGTLFRPELPGDLVGLALPGYALPILAPILGLALYRYRGRRDVLLPLLAIVAMVLVMWIAIRPLDLYARFFCWILPLVAIAIASQVRVVRALIVAAAVATAVILGTQYGDYARPEQDNRHVAAIIDQAHARGLRVCGLGDMSSFDAYTWNYRYAIKPADLDHCDVAVGVWLPWAAPDEAAIRRRLPVETTYAARIPISVFTRSGAGVS